MNFEQRVKLMVIWEGMTLMWYHCDGNRELWLHYVHQHLKKTNQFFIVSLPKYIAFCKPVLKLGFHLNMTISSTLVMLNISEEAKKYICIFYSLVTLNCGMCFIPLLVRTSLFHVVNTMVFMTRPVPLGFFINKFPLWDGAGLWPIKVSQACPTG